MNYFRDVYKKRGTWWGATSKEQYLNIATKYFEDYLLNAPGSDSVTIHNIDILAAIHENKQDESKISKYFLISLEYDVFVGDLIYWSGEDWLVIQKEKRNFEAYNKVLAIRCNYSLKWIDRYGVLNESSCYLFGHLDSKVQDNFKLASGIVLPQSNKNLEIILPYFDIKSEQRFIVRGEAWRVLERDLISVNGILYLCLAEDLVDTFDDNTTLNIADYGNLNSGYIDIGLSSLTLGIGESFTFNPVLYKENKMVADAQFTYSSKQDNYFITINESTISGLAFGTAVFTVASVDQPNLTVDCTVNVLATGVEKIVLQLMGDDSIKWGRTRTYTAFYNNGGTPSEVAATFTLIGNESDLVTFVTQETNSCSIIANSQGLAGDVTLRATTTYGVIDKIISVVSVW